jgi:CRP/FNR family cyclic AMP-dependent transcriptional regulator
MVQDIEKKGPLASLSDDDVAALVECAKLREFKTDDVVLKHGQHNASLYIVTQGLLHVRRYGEGRQVLLGRLEPGGFFGDISLFDPGPTTASVVAVSPGKVLEIGGEDVKRFISVRPAAAAQLLSALLAEMAHRLRQTDERLVEAIFWGGLLRGE